MIIFTDRALKRMRERGISRAQVLETIKNPEIEITKVETGKNKIIVITLYWL